jgi:hypothetical protein
MKKIIKYLAVVLLAIAVFAGCKKDNYIVGGNLSNATTPLTTYDYLKNNRFKEFDTLLMIIDKAGLKDVINQKGITFYAPTDFSIDNYLRERSQEVQNFDPNKNYTIDSLIKYDLAHFKDSLNAYIIPKTVTYSSLTNNGVLFNTAMNSSNAVISYETTTDGTLGGTTVVSTLPRLEYYTFIKGAPLPSPLVASAIPDSVGVRVLCQTSGLTTATGQLNVLDNSHVLYFKQASQ